MKIIKVKLLVILVLVCNIFYVPVLFYFIICFVMEENTTSLFELYHRLHNNLRAQSSYLIGKLLTLADASFSDPQQRKAFKDLISQEVDKNFIEGAREIAIYTFRDVGKLFGEPIFADYGLPYPTKLSRKKKSEPSPNGGPPPSVKD